MLCEIKTDPHPPFVEGMLDTPQVEAEFQFPFDADV